MTHNTDSSVGFFPDIAGIIRSYGWARVDLLNEIPSTNSYALQAPQDWHFVAAHNQTAGRGRLSRSWQAPPGKSVAVSVTLPLPEDARVWGWIPLFAGAVTLDACSDLCPEVTFALKWPNDLLALETSGSRAGEWAKVAGVLCQVVPTSTPRVVVGIGLNVSQMRHELPVETATSLRLLGAAATREAVLKELAWRFHELGSTWNEPQEQKALEERVRMSCSTIGRDVVVHKADGTQVATRTIGIDDDGRLVTRVPDRLLGEGPNVMRDTVTYSVADIEHVRPLQEKRLGG